MRHLLDYILESADYKEFEQQMLLERNEKIFPTQQGKHEKLEIWAGQHCKQRQHERNVSDKEMLYAIFGAFKDIRSAYRNGDIKLSFDGEDSQFVITDARRDKRNPVVVVAFIYKMLGAKNKKDAVKKRLDEEREEFDSFKMRHFMENSDDTTDGVDLSKQRLYMI